MFLLRAFDVVCISEQMDACIAEIALKLGCRVITKLQIQTQMHF